MRKRQIIAIPFTIGTCFVAAIAALMLVAGGESSASTQSRAADRFSAFTSSTPPPDVPELVVLASSLGRDSGDLSRLRVLAADLGRFASKLFAFPSRSGEIVCFSLLAKSRDLPGMSRCFVPNAASLPPELKGQHFDVVALESLVEDEVGVQLFGVAFDDIVALRAQVAGRWISIPISDNGFYADLPGRTHEEIGIVEATLSDGSTQVHDVQRGG